MKKNLTANLKYNFEYYNHEMTDFYKDKINSLKTKLSVEEIYLCTYYEEKIPRFIINNKKPKGTFNCIPTIILDSNICSGIHAFVQNKKINNFSLDFFKALVGCGFDFNPMFYMLECLEKNDDKNISTYHVPMLRSIITLQNINEDHFFNSNEILLRENFDLEEEVCRSIELFKKSPFRNGLQPLIRQSECYILIAILCKLENKVAEKIDLLAIFMNKIASRSLLVSAKELMIITMYFENKFSKFFNVQKSMTFEKAQNRIKASAFDFMLLSFQEMIFASNMIDENYHFEEFLYPLLLTKEKDIAEICKNMKLVEIVNSEILIESTNFSFSGEGVKSNSCEKLQKYYNHYLTSTETRRAVSESELGDLYEELKRILNKA